MNSQILNQELKSRKITFMSARLNEVSSESYTTVLYTVEENQNLPIDLIIERQTSEGVVTENYTIEENNSTRFATKMAVRNDILFDVLGVSNKTYYTAE